MTFDYVSLSCHIAFQNESTLFPECQRTPCLKQGLLWNLFNNFDRNICIIFENLSENVNSNFSFYASCQIEERPQINQKFKNISLTE